MSSTLKLVTAATFYPVTLDDGKEHLRVTATAEDGLIESYIQAATLYCEQYTGRIFSTQTWDMFMDTFPTVIEIPYQPVASVTWVKYYDADDVEQTLVEDTDYRVDLNTGRIEYIDNWPSTYDKSSAVNVRFVAGYASVSAVPQDIKQAVMLILGNYYENRQEVSIAMGGISQQHLVRGADNILDRHIIFNP